MALVAADVNKLLQKLLPAFLQSKKAFSQTVTILSENVLFCFEKQHEIEQIVVDQILGQVDEELSEAESEFSTEG